MEIDPAGFAALKTFILRVAVFVGTAAEEELFLKALNLRAGCGVGTEAGVDDEADGVVEVGVSAGESLLAAGVELDGASLVGAGGDVDFLMPNDNRSGPAFSSR